jgi:hypothetical protein
VLSISEKAARRKKSHKNRQDFNGVSEAGENQKEMSQNLNRVSHKENVT